MISFKKRSDGGTGRHWGLKIPWLLPCGFESRSEHQRNLSRPEEAFLGPFFTLGSSRQILMLDFFRVAHTVEHANLRTIALQRVTRVVIISPRAPSTESASRKDGRTNATPTFRSSATATAATASSSTPESGGISSSKDFCPKENRSSVRKVGFFMRRNFEENFLRKTDAKQVGDRDDVKFFKKFYVKNLNKLFLKGEILYV